MPEPYEDSLGGDLEALSDDVAEASVKFVERVDPDHIVGVPEPVLAENHVPFVDPTNVITLPEPAVAETGRHVDESHEEDDQAPYTWPPVEPPHTQSTTSATSDTTEES